MIATKNGFPVKIKDVGRVQVTGADPSSAMALDGVPSVAVGVRKQAGSNTVAVISNVKQRMANIIPTLPQDFKVVVVRDQSEFIQNSLHAIEEHLVLRLYSPRSLSSYSFGTCARPSSQPWRSRLPLLRHLPRSRPSVTR